MNIKYNYEIGKVYGLMRLDALMLSNRHTVAQVTCVSCGKRSMMKPSNLFKQKHISCTCQLKTAKGESSTRLYSIYQNMKYRCFTQSAPEYNNYGGRGITVCSEWLGTDGFQHFRCWAFNSGYDNTLTIDRIDENGMYTPENCEWVSLSENVARANRSKRIQHRKSNMGAYYARKDAQYIEFDNANQFAKEHDLNANMVRKAAHSQRVYKGWQFGFAKDFNIEKPQSTIEHPTTSELVEYGSGANPLPEAPSTEST